MRWLAINRCPIHRQFWSISVDDDNGGRRITPGKCCGQWEWVKRWKLDDRMACEIIGLMESVRITEGGEEA